MLLNGGTLCSSSLFTQSFHLSKHSQSIRSSVSISDFLPFPAKSPSFRFMKENISFCKRFLYTRHLEVFISVACKLSVDLVSTRPPFVYSCLKNFINDLIELVPVCTWFGWWLHISSTCQSPLIYVPSAKLLPSKNGATELSSKSSSWLNHSKMSWYVFGCL